jgi:DNA-binding NarL/FixJ family response regulator
MGNIRALRESPRLRVLLVDDHPLFLDGLRNLLTSRGIEVVGTARDGLEALDRARSLSPDLVLMDIRMPRCDGVAATRLIKAERPEILVVMLTMSAEDEDLFAAIKSGACGYLVKTLDTEEFFALFQSLAHGEAAFSPGLAARVLQEFAREGRESGQAETSSAAVGALSPRQVEVLTLVSQGMPYKEVAARLGLTERTIKYHMGEIMDRLHLENRAEVLAYARDTGLLRI